MLPILDFKSGNLKLYLLIGSLDVIKRYLLSWIAVFQIENNKFSGTFSSKLSIIKASLVLNLKKIFSSKEFD